MSHYEEDDELKRIEEGIERIEDILENTNDQINEAKEFAPDAADTAEDKLETAREKLENAKEKLGNAQTRLYEFKEKARYAAEVYDEFQSTSDPRMEPKVEKARLAAERMKGKLETSVIRSINSLEKAKTAAEKANSRANIAIIKANAAESKEKSRKVRINFTLPEEMKKDWKGLADQLNISISQMIRTAMDSFEKGLDNLDNLDKIGKFGNIQIEKKPRKRLNFDNLEHKIDSWGDKIEMFVKDQVDQSLTSNKPMQKATINGGGITLNAVEKEKIHKRIIGLLKIKQAIPIEKFANILNCSKDKAENLIYELAAEGIEGIIEDGIFKYTTSTEQVIETIFKILDES